MEKRPPFPVGAFVTSGLETGSRQELTVEAIGSDGAGVGRAQDGRVVFVHRTAPGDRVSVEITSVRRRWARARLLEVLKAAPDRRPPPCVHYQNCGGCTLEHISYPAQLRAKGRLVIDALTRIGGRRGFPAPELHASPRTIRYRNRVTFTLVRPRTGEVAAGFHRLESPEQVLDVDGRCLLPEEAIATAWDGLRSCWGPSANRLPSGPRLRLTLRGVEDGRVLLLIEGGEGAGEPGVIISKVPELSSIWHRPEGSSRSPHCVSGDPNLTEFWFGEEIEVRPTGFLQGNREAAARLHEAVIEEAGTVRSKRVLDAYCGFGAVGRRLALSGARVLGIEVDPEAVRMSRERPIEGFRVMEGRVEDLLHQALPLDFVILNPPRNGVKKGVMEGLASARPDRMIYVSCDPATLARDMGRVGNGYRVSRLQVFDLFPQTAHVETVVTLEGT